VNYTHSRFIHPSQPVTGGDVSDVPQTPDNSPSSQAFAATLTYWRDVRGRSKRALAKEMGFDPSYVSHVEAGRFHPSKEFAERAEEVLDTGKALWRSYLEDEATKHSGAGHLEDAPTLVAVTPALLVEHDHAELTYAAGVYHLAMRRWLLNTGTEPVSRYLIRISVDRWPGDPERSNALYRAAPLTWDELGLSAYCDGEPMDRTVKFDRDAFKEVWLHFSNTQNRFPLYPGERTLIEYSYSVPATKWGHWFQRAIRLPTSQLSVQLNFPTSLDPVVWGTETSMTAESSPLRTAIGRSCDGGTSAFAWSCADPQLDARYRLEWRFRIADGHGDDEGEEQ
jgi:transcriptional regulator with XRE-family HTH domain